MQEEFVLMFDDKATAERQIPYKADWTVTEEDTGYALFDRKHNRYVTNFRLKLIELVKETHKRRDGSMRHYSWRKYEDEYAQVGGYGDYSGHSIEYRRALDVLVDTLDYFEEKNEGDQELYTIFWWPHNGRDIAIRVLDGIYGLPTPMAYWYYTQSPFPAYFEALGRAMVEFHERSWSRFVSDFVSPNGTVGTIGADVMSKEEYVAKHGYPPKEYDPDPAAISVTPVDYERDWQVRLEGGAYDHSWLEDKIRAYDQRFSEMENRYTFGDMAFWNYRDFITVPSSPYETDDPDPQPFEDEKAEAAFRSLQDIDYFWSSSRTNEYGIGQHYDDPTENYVLPAVAVLSGLVDFDEVRDWFPVDDYDAKRHIIRQALLDENPGYEQWQSVMFAFLKRVPEGFLKSIVNRYWDWESEFEEAQKRARFWLWKNYFQTRWEDYTHNFSHSADDVKSELMRGRLTMKHDLKNKLNALSVIYMIYGRVK